MKIDIEPKDKISNWWNDGDNKLKKIQYIFLSWWNNGSNKLIKALFISLFLHFVFGIAWFLKFILI